MKLAFLMRDNPETTFNGISTFCRELTKELRKRHEVEWFIGGTDRKTLAMGSSIPKRFDLIYVLALPYGAKVRREFPMVVKCNSPLKEEAKYYTGFKRLKGIYGQFQELSSLNKARAVISVSQISHDILLKEYSAESVIIPDGVDLEAFKPEKESGVQPRLFWAGRSEKRKGSDIFGRLPKDGIDWGAAWGTTSQSGYQFLMNQADIFLSTSLSEGFNQTLLQAMASGCACLASKIPAHMELIREGYDGYLFKSEGEMRYMMNVLIGSAELRQSLGAAARKKAENYPWSRTAIETEKVFENALVS